MIVERKLVIVIKDTGDGWVAYSNSLPNLYVKACSYNQARDAALPAARKMCPGAKFICKPIRNEPPKPTVVEKPIPPRCPNLTVFENALVQLRAAGRLWDRMVRNEKVYVLDGRIGAKIPEIITAAGYEA